MNLKEIIIEKLIFGFKQNKPKWWDYKAYLRFIEPTIRGAVNSATSNITTTDDWQVIASGEVKICGEYESQHLRFCDKNRKPKYKRLTYEDFTEYEGKDIEIIVKIK